MMNVKRKSGKMTYRKGVRLLAAAALTAAMVGGQTQGVLAQSDTAIEAAVSILPENITIEEPVALSEVALPENEYGTLAWVDDSCVPSKRVQSYEVKLTPFESVDLSKEEGWDAEEGVLRGYVTVVVSSIEDSGEEEVPPTEIPEQTVTPVPSVTPVISQLPDAGEEITGIPDEGEGEISDEEKDEQEGTESEESQIGEAEIGESGETAEEGTAPEVTQPPIENIFDQEESLKEDERPVTAEEDLSPEEQMVRAAENHSCNGISVSGISLPWYVQFRVSSGDDYQFTNEIDASIFKSYEFELWDLRTDTEYEIPDGEYISVTVPVKEGYEYTIEHLLDNGAIETIIPSVEGDTMVFSTHSFSPFGIAGSKPVIGSDIAEEGYGDSNTSQTGSSGSTTEVPVSPAASSNTTSTSGTNQATAQNTNDTEESTEDNTSSSSRAVDTGDETKVLPFAALAAAAALVMTGTAAVYKKRK